MAAVRKALHAVSSRTIQTKKKDLVIVTTRGRINAPRTCQVCSIRRNDLSAATNAFLTRQFATTNHERPPQQSSQISNSFWQELKLAVHHRNAAKAEELVFRLLDEATEQESTLDTKLFSLVLESWKDASENGDPAAPARSQQLLEQMMTMYDRGLLTQPPHLEDYHVFLRCVKESDYSLKECSPDNMHRLLESLIQNSHQPSIETYELILSIFAKGGHLDDAIQLFEVVVSTETDISPTVKLYNSVLECWANAIREESASADEQNVSNSHIRRRRPQEAHAFFEDMIREGVAIPNTTTFERIIECWAASRVANGAKKAEDLLDQMWALRIKPNSNIYKLAIQALARDGEAERAETLLSRNAKDYAVQFDADLKPDLQVFQHVLYAYSKFHHPFAASKAESLLTHMKELYQCEMLDTKPNVWSYTTVMQCWVNSNAHDAGDQALRLYEEMRTEGGVVPDTLALNTLLHAYVRSKTASETDELLRIKVEDFLSDPFHNAQPDSISFGTSLSAWAKQSRTQKCPEAPDKAESLLSLLHKLKSRTQSEGIAVNCEPDSFTYANVIQCWANSRNRNAPERAEALLRQMQLGSSEDDNARMTPDAVCWNSAISAWAQAGNGERAESLFKEMLKNYTKDKTKYPAPTAITFTAVLSAWTKTKNDSNAPERALSILRSMERLAMAGALPGFRPNVVHYSTVLNCFAYSKSKAAAIQSEQLLQEMWSSHHPAIQPNVLSYNAVIKAWSFFRDDADAYFRAEALFNELLEKAKHDRKLRPTKQTYGNILKTLAQSKVKNKKQRAKYIVKEMKKFGMHMDSWTHNQYRRCMA